MEGNLQCRGFCVCVYEGADVLCLPLGTPSGCAATSEAPHPPSPRGVWHVGTGWPPQRPAAGKRRCQGLHRVCLAPDVSFWTKSVSFGCPGCCLEDVGSEAGLARRVTVSLGRFRLTRRAQSLETKEASANPHPQPPPPSVQTKAGRTGLGACLASASP